VLVNGESLEAYRLAEEFANYESRDDHFSAVQAQALVAAEFYKGLLEVVAKQNGLASESLLRSLFESAANAAILAKNRAKLSDFIRHGQFTQLRLLRFNEIEDPAIKAYVENAIKITEDDFHALFNEFKATDWHKLKTRDSFKEAGYSEEMYDKYFRRASAYSHGEPYVCVRPSDHTWKRWGVSPHPARWKTLCIGSYIFGTYALLQMMTIVNSEFELGLDERIRNVTQQIDAFKERHVEGIRSSFEEVAKASIDLEGGR
jgi:hypothetical protein